MSVKCGLGVIVCCVVCGVDEGSAVSEFEREDVERMIEFCRRGPYGARVSGVEVVWEDYTGGI